MYIIGVLSFYEETIDEVRELEEELNQSGYAVHLEQMGFNTQSPEIGDFYYEEEAIILWLCRCYGDADRCNVAVNSFIETGVNIIVAMNRKALDIALLKTDGLNIPIIFSHVTREQKTKNKFEQLRKLGIVTGVWDVWLEIAVERMSLLTEVVPPPTAVHAFYNPETPAVMAEVNILREASSDLNLDLILHEVSDTQDVKRKVASLQTNQNHAFFRLADPTTSQSASFMGAIAHEQYIPYIGLTVDELERCGALFALEAEGTGILIAKMIARILRGESPSTIQFRQPSQKLLGVNLQSAQELRLIVSPAVLSRAHIKIPAQESTQLGTQFIRVFIFYLVALSVIILVAHRLEYPFLLGLIGSLTLIFALWMGLLLTRRVFVPIRALAIAAEKVGSGELNTPVKDTFYENDEIATLARSLQRMKNNLLRTYADLDQVNKTLKQRVEELVESDKALREAQAELKLANSRIIEADNSSRFSLTTYIHDEILGPIDELSVIASEEHNIDLTNIAQDLEDRVRRVRYDLSVPILKDVGIELRRLIQETLPQIFPNSQDVELSLNLSAFDDSPELESAASFLAYRFIRGAVSNVYRHAKANNIYIEAVKNDGNISMRVSDDGDGFDTSNIDTYIRNGHYFFHDIQIRTNQLRGNFRVRSELGKGTALELVLPVQKKKNSGIRVNI
jgi:ABC-type uncharacterized transport system substrate-binding protein/HAMP domain-containing protein